MISINLMIEISRDFSYLSASCPAVAENRKNGRIKIPAAKMTRICGLMPSRFAKRYVISITRAFLKVLSLKAPKNWVINKGKKRLVLSNSSSVDFIRITMKATSYQSQIDNARHFFAYAHRPH